MSQRKEAVILVVDNDFNAAQGVKPFLYNEGHVVHTA
jgi:hypothetical protein